MYHQHDTTSIINNSESGALNIATLAIGLPILLLLLTASVDIIKLPLAKQQLLGTLTNAFDSLVAPSGSFNRTESIAIQGLDTLYNTLNIDSVAKQCPLRKEDNIPCTNLKQARIASSAALSHILKDLTELSSPIFKHSYEDLTIEIGIVNLLVNQHGEYTGVQPISYVRHPQPTSEADTSIGQSDLIESIGIKKKAKLGIWIYGSGTNSYYSNRPLAILQASVKIRNLFGFSNKLTSSLNSTTNPHGQRFSIISARLIRPLTKSISLERLCNDQP